MTCKARQHSDQMICGKCGFQWDVNDIDPPTCLDIEQVLVSRIKPINKSSLAIINSTPSKAKSTFDQLKDMFKND